jgi:L-asparagine oxygenase
MLSGTLASRAREFLADLERTGQAFLPSWQVGRKTAEIAATIGRVVNVPSLLPGAVIPTIQTLVPRQRKDSLPNQYSAAFGLSEFPLHTDLAQWYRPPRYLLLRCVSGGAGVATRVLPVSSLADVIPVGVLRRAVVRPRRVRPGHASVLLPLVFHSWKDGFALRWDSMFVVPMNDAGRRVAEAMATTGWDAQITSHYLTNPDDTLILDNWRCLHGRGEVGVAGMTRRLERAYISSCNL